MRRRCMDHFRIHQSNFDRISFFCQQGPGEENCETYTVLKGILRGLGPGVLGCEPVTWI